MLSRTLARNIARRGLANGVQSRTVMTLNSVKYTGRATASGPGRNGAVESKDLELKLRLAMPPELGGPGDGHNPEELVAMGYAGCFLGALQLVAGKQGKTDATRNAVINVSVHLGEPKGQPGFGVNVDIEVEGVEDEQLVQDAHKACPYSRAFTQGIPVNVKRK